MMKRAVLLAMMAASAVGCGLEEGETVYMMLDPEADFTDEQIALIDSAARNWEDATEGYVKFEWVTEKGPTNLIVFKSASIEDLHEKYDEYLGGKNHHLPGERGGSIELVNDLDDAPRFRSIAAHEIGHALGCPDLEDDQPFSIMRQGHKAKDITCTDIELFCEANGCDPIDFKLCQAIPKDNGPVLVKVEEDHGMRPEDM